MAPSKARKTFTLDPELVGYLETFRQERKAESTSAALEEILRESKRRREVRKLESSISGYYDALPARSRREESDWGEFSESQFPKE